MFFYPVPPSPPGQCWKSAEKDLPTETQVLVTCSEFSTLIWGEGGRKTHIFSGGPTVLQKVEVRTEKYQAQVNRMENVSEVYTIRLRALNYSVRTG